MSKVSVDMIYAGTERSRYSGSTARRLLQSGLKTNALRTNDTLLYDEWKSFDDIILKAARIRLKGVQQFLSRGFVHTVKQGLGRFVLQYQDSNDLQGAEVSMDPATRGKGDRLEFTHKLLPLPIIHKDFSIGIRELTASRDGLEPLDTASVESASFAVNTMVEAITFNGLNNFAYGGGTIYGLTDFPNRHTGNLLAHWDDAATTGIQILDDVLAMQQALINDRHNGPYGLFIPRNYSTKMKEDYKQLGSLSIEQRLLQDTELQFIQVVDVLTAGQVVMVELSQNTARMVEALPLQVVEWDEMKMQFNFKVMTILVPQVRADQYGRCGIANYSAA